MASHHSNKTLTKTPIYLMFPSMYLENALLYEFHFFYFYENDIKLLPFGPWNSGELKSVFLAMVNYFF